VVMLLALLAEALLCLPQTNVTPGSSRKGMQRVPAHASSRTLRETGHAEATA